MLESHRNNKLLSSWKRKGFRIGTIAIIAVALVVLPKICMTTGRRAFINQLGNHALGHEQKRCLLDSKLTVSIAGLPRSGSTMAYNIVRMLFMHYQPSLLYGWIGDSIANKTIRQYIHKHHHKLSIVCKTHNLDDSLAKASDLIVFTHRDPIEQICSLGLMFEGKILKNCSYAQEHCRRIKDLQTLLYKRAINRSIIDIDYQKVLHPSLQHEVVDELADKFHLDKECIPSSFYENLANLETPEEGIFSKHHPFTLMHAGHSHNDRSKCKDIKSCLLSDSTCKAWIARGGRIQL